MRIRLSFTLALFLLGGAAPLHASSGSTATDPKRTARGPQEQLAPQGELSQAVPNYNAEDRDYLIRTIAFEAPKESDEGKAAVAYVILNRTKSGR